MSMKALRTLYPTLALPPKARFSLGVSFISGIISLFRLLPLFQLIKLKNYQKRYWTELSYGMTWSKAGSNRRKRDFKNVQKICYRALLTRSLWAYYWIDSKHPGLVNVCKSTTYLIFNRLSPKSTVHFFSDSQRFLFLLSCGFCYFHFNLYINNNKTFLSAKSPKGISRPHMDTNNSRVLSCFGSFDLSPIKKFFSWVQNSLEATWYILNTNRDPVCTLDFYSSKCRAKSPAGHSRFDGGGGN